MVEGLLDLPPSYAIVEEELEVESLFLHMFVIVHQLVCSAEETQGQ